VTRRTSIRTRVRGSKERMDHWSLVKARRERPGMWLPEVTYEALAAFLVGYDAALSGGLLTGFKEFVQLKFGQQSSVVWWSLS
jgi:hypothetical protein